MKKLFLAITILLICTGTGIFAQNGYQNYTFGMSMEQIKSVFPDAEESTFTSNSLTYLMYHLHKSELPDRMPNPYIWAKEDIRILYTGEYTWLSSSYYFIFNQNRLVGVVTFFPNENVLPDLVNRYGSGLTYGMVFQNSTFLEGRIWQNGTQRFITWEMYEAMYTNYQVVSYFDAAWVRDLCQKAINNYREEQQRIRSRLD